MPGTGCFRPWIAGCSGNKTCSPARVCEEPHRVQTGKRGGENAESRPNAEAETRTPILRMTKNGGTLIHPAAWSVDWSCVLWVGDKGQKLTGGQAIRVATLPVNATTHEINAPGTASTHRPE